MSPVNLKKKFENFCDCITRLTWRHITHKILTYKAPKIGNIIKKCISPFAMLKWRKFTEVHVSANKMHTNMTLD